MATSSARRRRGSRRVRGLFGLSVFLIMVLVVRIAYLQMGSGPKQALSEVTSPYVSTSTIAAQRGGIWVNLPNGQLAPLVMGDTSGSAVTYLPGEVLDQARLHQVEAYNAHLLAPVLLPYLQKYWKEHSDQKDTRGVLYRRPPTLADVEALLLANERYNMPKSWKRTINAFNENNPMLTTVPIDLKDQQYISGQLDNLQGVSVEPANRVIEMPYAQTLVGKSFMDNVVGQMTLNPMDKGDSNKRFLADPNELNGPHPGWGLQLYYDKVLAGKPGERLVTTDWQENTAESKVITPPQEGQDLILGIDLGLQQVAQYEIDHLLATLQSRGSAARQGSIVVLNPKNGQVLAMAEHNPLEAPASGFLPVQDAEFPGSTAKPATVAMGLMEGIITPNTTLYDPGEYSSPRTGNRPIKEWTGGGSPTGQTLTPRSALSKSSNVFMSMIGDRLLTYESQKLGTSDINQYGRAAVSVLQRYENMFGLGAVTGIDIPNERKGKDVRAVLDEGSLWTDASAAQKQFNARNFMTTGFGQLVQFTPIQLAQYTAAIATGERLAPHVAAALQPPGGTHRTAIAPKVLNKIAVNDSYLALIREGMVGVTQPGGTAVSAFVGTPYKVAAKTGTAETGAAGDNSVFIGFAPADNPQVVVAVLVPKAGTHGADAAPPARDLFDVALHYKTPEQILGHGLVGLTEAMGEVQQLPTRATLQQPESATPPASSTDTTPSSPAQPVQPRTTPRQQAVPQQQALEQRPPRQPSVSPPVRQVQQHQAQQQQTMPQQTVPQQAVPQQQTVSQQQNVPPQAGGNGAP
ncbi:MAG: hypothetical protein IMW91_06855 [Firmicutes bacterium]|nr:hypothetical protein [Bacillota bacterium]